MENSDDARDEKIRGVLDQELEDGSVLATAARDMIAFLLFSKKGYGPDEVRRDAAFDVILGTEKAGSSVDFLITLQGSPAMIIKCAAGSLSSRERQAVAAARVIASPPVPVAVVADPQTAIVIDVGTGTVTGEGFGAIPVREQLVELVSAMKREPLSSARIEKEKRILLAFDAIACCVPQGGDGKGVRI